MRTKSAVVWAVGTSFNVHTDDAGRTSVVVFEGVVKIIAERDSASTASHSPKVNIIQLVANSKAEVTCAYVAVKRLRVPVGNTACHRAAWQTVHRSVVVLAR